jgi:transposase
MPALQAVAIAEWAWRRGHRYGTILVDLTTHRVVVKAGLTLAWSNGVTEGQIHRLRSLKRQGDGHAGFTLLRQRVLQAA